MGLGVLRPQTLFIGTTMSSLSFLALLTCVSWTTAVSVGTTGLLFTPTEVVCTVTKAPEVLGQATEFVPVLSQGADDSTDPDNKPMDASAAAEAVLNDLPPAAAEGATSAMAAGSEVAFAIPVAAPARIVGKGDATGYTSAGVSGGVPGGVAGGVAVIKIERGRGFGRGLPPPSYPEQARLNGWEGSVTVRFAVDASGRVMVAKVVTSSGRPLLDQEALETVRRRWKFPAGAPAGPFDWTAHFILK